nr:RNA-splicing ligase RtcB [Escherichia coli]
MGNYIRPLSDAVFTIASDDLWIESLAIQQLHTTANLPNMQRVVGMPDLHPGRGYPISAAFFSVGRFYPALVGNDIGCGMALWQTDILTRKYNADKFEKRLSDLDDVAEESWLEENLPSAFAQHPWRSSLGSIGGGNHFAELQQVDQIINAELFALAGLDAQHCNCWFIAARGGWGSLFYSGILPRSRIMVCLKAVTTRYGILRNMTMRWRLRVLIAR